MGALRSQDTHKNGQNYGNMGTVMPSAFMGSAANKAKYHNRPKQDERIEPDEDDYEFLSCQNEENDVNQKLQKIHSMRSSGGVD
jgi:hypothetical protein